MRFENDREKDAYSEGCNDGRRGGYRQALHEIVGYLLDLSQEIEEECAKYDRPKIADLGVKHAPATE